MKTLIRIGLFFTLFSYCQAHAVAVSALARASVSNSSQYQIASTAEIGKAHYLGMADSLTLMGEFRAARKYYLQAFEDFSGTEADPLLYEHLEKLAAFYELIARRDPKWYDSLRAETYTWHNFYLPITRLDTIYEGGGMNVFAHIDVPAAIGFSDQVITVYGAIDRDTGTNRDLAWIMEGDLAGSDSSGTRYSLRMDDPDILWPVRVGDFVVAELRGPSFKDDLIATAFTHHILFRGNYRDIPLSLALLLSVDYPHFRSAIEQFYNYQVLEIYDFFKEDTFEVLNQMMHQGMFTGYTGMQALGISTWKEEKEFIRFALDHLATYSGSSFKFSEAYANWIINHAPMSRDHFRDYFLAQPDSILGSFLQAYLAQITKGDYLAEWLQESRLSVRDRLYPLALELGRLCAQIARLSGDSQMLASSLYIQAEVYSGLNMDQRSMQLAAESERLFAGAGDREGTAMCRKLLTELQQSDSVEIVVQSGHPYPFELCMHPQGLYYYTGGWDGFIKMWDYRSGMIIRELKAHDVTINSITCSRDGRYLVSADDLGVLKVFEASTLEEVWQYQHKDEFIAEADISSDGSLLAFCSYGKLIYVLSLKERKLIRKLERHEAQVTSVRFHPTRNILLSAGRDSMMYTWNLDDFSKRGWYRESSQIYHISISPDGRTCMLVRRDSMVAIWDFFDAKRIGLAPTVLSRLGTSIFFAKPAFSSDNRLAAFYYRGEREWLCFLRMSDLYMHTFRNPHDDIISGLAFHPDGKAMISAGHDLQIKTYDLSNYQFLKTASLRIVTNKPSAAEPRFVQFDSSGKHLLTLISTDQFLLSDLNLENGERRLIQRSLTIGDQNHYVQADNRIAYLELNDSLSITGFEDRQVKSVPVNFTHADYYAFFPDLSKVCLRVLEDGSFRLYETSGVELLRVVLPNSRQLKMPYNFATIAGENVAYLACNSHSLVRVDLNTGKVDSVALGKRGKLKVLGVLGTTNNDRLIVHADRLIGMWDRKLNKWLWKHAYNPDDEQYTSIAVSHDLQYIAMASYMYRVDVYDMNASRLVWSHDKFGYFISHMHFNPKAPVLAVASADMRLRLFNYLDDKLLFNIYPQRDGELIVMNDQGAYWADKKSLKGIAFKVQDQIYPVEQFDVFYNRPAQVLKSSPFANTVYTEALGMATERRLKREGARGNSSSLHMPNVRIGNRAGIPRLSRQRTLVLEVECYEYADSLKALHASVNGVPVYGREGLALDSAHFARERLELALGYGSNLIKIWCTNSSGFSSLRESLEINVMLERPRPDLYIAVMAVADYRNDEYDLKYPVKDALDLVKQLSLDTGLYREIHTLIFTDSQVNREKLPLVQQFFSEAAVDDRVILFITGHGVLDREFEFYFATSDLDFGDPGLRGIRYPEIESLLETSPARQRLLMMDACHSGELDPETVMSDTDTLPGRPGLVSGFQERGGKAKRSKPVVGLQNSFNLMRELFADIGSNNGIQVISAASGDSYALESDQWQNGVFTYAVLKGLQNFNADLNQDKDIFVSELREYVIREVYAQTGGKQRPTMRSENIEFDFQLR